jgi:hypothetical protein
MSFTQESAWAPREASIAPAKTPTITTPLMALGTAEKRIWPPLILLGSNLSARCRDASTDEVGFVERAIRRPVVGGLRHGPGWEGIGTMTEMRVTI